MTSWEQWCAGVIAGVGEPLSAVSVDTHWAWSDAETAPYDLMRWNNPQNTTEPWPNARESGAQPGLHDVKIYATLQDGIDATVYTLLKEPYYSAIVANLRAGLPRQQWGATSAAGSELHAWGTGTRWLTGSPYFGAAPGQLLEDDMPLDPADPIVIEIRQGLDGLKGVIMTPPPTQSWPALQAKLDQAIVAIKAIPVGGGAPIDLASLEQTLANVQTLVTEIRSRFA